MVDPEQSPGEQPSDGWWSRTRRDVRRWLGPSQPEMEFEGDFEAVEQQLWGLSAERRWYVTRRSRGYAGAALGVVLLAAAALVGQPTRSDAEQWWAVILAVLAACALGYSTFPYWAARQAFNERRRKMAAYVASEMLRKIRGETVISLNVLFAYNRRQLDAYQEEARNQQRLAFRYALWTSTLGFAVLLAGISVSFRLGPGSETYVAGGLSAVGAALSAYVAGTMLRIYHRADTQLNRFYLEPHMLGRLLLAERLMDSRDTAGSVSNRDTIIRRILEWPLPGSDEPAEKDPDG